LLFAGLMLTLSSVRLRRLFQHLM